MPVDVLLGEGSERLIVHDDDIRRSAGLQNTQRLSKVPRADGGIVAEKHLHVLAPAYVGVAGVMPLDEEKHLQGLQHVVGIGVGAHTHQDAPLHHLQHRRTAHGVAHIGLWIIDHHGAGLPKDLHLGGIDMDAVAQDGLFPQNTVV